MTKYIGIYLIDGNGENYTLFGLYPMDNDTNAKELFASIVGYLDPTESKVNGRVQFAHLIYSTDGEPLRIYPAFPVEQLDTEHGPFTLSYLHKSLFGTSYNHMEWVDYSDL